MWKSSTRERSWSAWPSVRADLKNMLPDGNGRIRLDYRIPARGLIGFRTEYLTATAGTGLLYNVFDALRPAEERRYRPAHQWRADFQWCRARRWPMACSICRNAAACSLAMAKMSMKVWSSAFTAATTIWSSTRLKAKQLTNIRAAGTDENLVLSPPIRISLEQALEFIDDDELVEVTPKSIRIRKKQLKEQDRKRTSRAAE